MCRLVLGALNRWFKWASTKRIRITNKGGTQQRDGLTPG